MSKLIGYALTHHCLKEAATEGVLTFEEARTTISCINGQSWPPGTTTEDILNALQRCGLVHFDSETKIVTVLSDEDEDAT